MSNSYVWLFLTLNYIEYNTIYIEKLRDEENE